MRRNLGRPKKGSKFNKIDFTSFTCLLSVRCAEFNYTGSSFLCAAPEKGDISPFVLNAAQPKRKTKTCLFIYVCMLENRARIET